MTDSEKLDLILDKVSSHDEKFKSIDEKLNCLDKKVSSLDNRVSSLDNRVSSLDKRVSNLETQVSSLQSGQIDIRNELDAINKKVSETYQIALDAWGTSVENRKWLETAK